MPRMPGDGLLIGNRGNPPVDARFVEALHAAYIKKKKGS